MWGLTCAIAIAGAAVVVLAPKEATLRKLENEATRREYLPMRNKARSDMLLNI